MKYTNEPDGKQMTLKERTAKELGDRLAGMAIGTRQCWFLATYEPELPLEMIKEMMDAQQG